MPFYHYVRRLLARRPAYPLRCRCGREAYATWEKDEPICNACVAKRLLQR